MTENLAKIKFYLFKNNLNTYLYNNYFMKSLS